MFSVYSKRWYYQVSVRPLFPGESGVDQLVEIVEVDVSLNLGSKMHWNAWTSILDTLTREEIKCMNLNWT